MRFRNLKNYPWVLMAEAYEDSGWPNKVTRFGARTRALSARAC